MTHRMWFSLEKRILRGEKMIVHIFLDDDRIIRRTMTIGYTDGLMYEGKEGKIALAKKKLRTTNFWSQLLVEGDIFNLHEQSTADWAVAEGSEKWGEVVSLDQRVTHYLITSLSRNENTVTHARTNRGLQFFPYYNDTPLDLDFVQIYKNDSEYPTHDQHCLIKTFEEAKRLKPELPFNMLQVAELMVKYKHNNTDKFDMQNLSKAAVYLGVQIRVERVEALEDKTGRRRNFFKLFPNKAVENTPVVEIGVYEDHVFLNRLWTDIRSKNALLIAAEVIPKPEFDLSVPGAPWSTLKIIHTLRTEGKLNKVVDQVPEVGIGGSDTLLEVVNYDVCEQDEESGKRGEGTQQNFTPRNKDKKIIPHVFYAADTESICKEGKTHSVYDLAFIKIDQDGATEDEIQGKLAEVTILSGDNAPIEMLRHILAVEQTTIDEAQAQADEAAGKSSKKRKWSSSSEIFVVYIFFHNLRYDRAVIQKGLDITRVLEKDNSIYSFDVMSDAGDVRFSFRDSRKMVSEPLSKWSQALDLPPSLSKKEKGVFYEYFNEEKRGQETTIREYAYSDQDNLLEERSTEVKQALEELKIPFETREDGEIVFFPDDLYQRYLRYDVVILAQGLTRYRKLLSTVYLNVTREDEIEEDEAVELEDNIPDPLLNVSLSSYGKTIFNDSGCRDDVFEYGGSLRKYIMSSVRGGRTTCHPQFEGSEIRTSINYFDGVSLYPSSMKAECTDGIGRGYPKGQAFPLELHELKEEFIFNEQEVAYAIVTIKLLKIRKTLTFVPPVICLLRSSGELEYTDMLSEEEEKNGVQVTLALMDLKAWIQFHNIEYEIIQGCYWKTTAGFNNRAGILMDKLFQERLVVKSTNKALGNMYKLVMNSIYGSSILKITDFEQVCFPKDGEWLLNVFNSFQKVHSIFDLGQTIQIQKYKPDESFTPCIFGSMVLARARWIMNGLWTAAEKSKTFIFYTDTDSVFIERERMPFFKHVYENNKHPLLPDLVGSGLMQFHNDFSSKSFGADWKKEYKEDDIFSISCIPVRKKVYCHQTVYYPPGGTEAIFGICNKMKGCTEIGVKFIAEDRAKIITVGEPTTREKEIEMFEIYRNLVGLTGDDTKVLEKGPMKIKFPLNPGGKARFYYDRSTKTCHTSSIVSYREVSMRDLPDSVGGHVYSTFDLEIYRI